MFNDKLSLFNLCLILKKFIKCNIYKTQKSYLGMVTTTFYEVLLGNKALPAFFYKARSALFCIDRGDLIIRIYSFK